MKIWRVYFFVALLVVPVGCKSSSELMLPRGDAVTDDGGVVILSEVAGSSQKPLRLEFYRGSSVAWERSADSFKGGMVVGAGIDVRGGMVAIVVAFWVGEKRVTRLSLYQLSNGEEPWSRVLEGSEWSKSVWGQVFVFDKAVSVVDRGSVFSVPIDGLSVQKYVSPEILVRASRYREGFIAHTLDGGALLFGGDASGPERLGVSCIDGQSLIVLRSDGRAVVRNLASKDEREVQLRGELVANPPRRLLGCRLDGSVLKLLYVAGLAVGVGELDIKSGHWRREAEMYSLGTFSSYADFDIRKHGIWAVGTKGGFAEPGFSVLSTSGGLEQWIDLRVQGVPRRVVAFGDCAQVVGATKLWAFSSGGDHAEVELPSHRSVVATRDGHTFVVSAGRGRPKIAHLDSCSLE